MGRSGQMAIKATESFGSAEEKSSGNVALVMGSLSLVLLLITGAVLSIFHYFLS